VRPTAAEGALFGISEGTLSGALESSPSPVAEQACSKEPGMLGLMHLMRTGWPHSSAAATVPVTTSVQIRTNHLFG